MDVRRGLGSEWWVATCNSAFVPLVVTADERSHGELHWAQFHGIGVSRLIGGDGEVVRTAQLINSGPRDVALLSLALDGALHVSDGRRTTVGQTALCFADRPYSINADGPLDVVTLRVPVDRIQGRGHDHMRDSHARPISPARHHQADLLRDFLVSLLDAAPGDVAEGRVLSRITVDLLSLVLRSAHDDASSVSRSTRQDTFSVAQALINKRFSDPAITIRQIAHECCVSRRELELAFAAQGVSPAAYIRRVRLAAALSLLQDDSTYPPISHIAHEVGFSDVTTFIRAFRRVHDTTPHAWRVTAAKA